MAHEKPRAHGRPGSGQPGREGEKKGGAVLETPDGILFLGLDGSLYRAEYDPEHWSLYDSESFPGANGWEIAKIRPEWWEGVFPIYAL